ncbi:MAG: dienelactone hydrolase family protein [Pseudomonadales bacterium]|jgi:dienelactone hydrolase|nr:dienelactone hydrolase family protein [Pseudomonadales bacterium]
MKRILLGLGLAMLATHAGAQTADNYTPPLTPWGEPDLRGIWPLNHLISVPVVRPAEFGERFLLSDEELQERSQSIAARDERFQSGPIPQADAAGQALSQTSLIYDPPDGQFPELTPYGKQLQALMKGSYHPTQTVFDAIEDFSSWDRCITRGMPVSMLARNYNNGIRIFQTPGYVVISLEMAHEARIIPTTPTPPLDPAIKQWLGESRGHWEGNTLVVETTNFGHGLVIGLTSAGNPGSPGPLQPFSDDMKITERFTRSAEGVIDFEMTVSDPQVLARGSYTYKFPLFLDNSYEIYEYACHEGNTAVRNYIETSRFERAAAQGAQAEPVLRPLISEAAIPVQEITPLASDGTPGEAFLRKPPGNGPFPAVVLIHGGAPRWSTEMLRDYALHIHASRFLEAGYVVVTMTRRDVDLNLPFSEEQPAVKDALAVIDYVKSLPYVDPASVVVRGTSVGGYLSLEVAAAREVAAVMVEEPFSFPFVGISGANPLEQKPDLSKIARIKSPLLVIEGDQTPNINEFNTQVFLPALRAAGKAMELQRYPGELHSFAFFDNAERSLHPAVSLQAFARIDDFFREHLPTQPQAIDPALVSHEAIARP